jgi:hypothetical protein
MVLYEWILPKYFNTIKSEFREIETIQHAQLDQYLEEFFVGIRKETKEGECLLSVYCHQFDIVPF